MRQVLLWINHSVHMLLYDIFDITVMGQKGAIEYNKGIGDAGSTADIRMLWPWSALVCLGLL